MSQRDPASPAFVLQTVALANDTVPCQDPACLSINLIDSAHDMRRDDSSRNKLTDLSKSERAGRKNLIPPPLSL